MQKERVSEKRYELICRFKAAWLAAIVSIVFIIMTGCRDRTDRFSTTVIHETVLQDIPSGSAALFYKDSLLIVGDDATCLYRVALANHQFSQYPIEIADRNVARVSKDQKLDLEAVTMETIEGKACMFAFGSGSVVGGKRDTLMTVVLDHLSEQRFYSLEKLYAFLRSQTGIKPEDWNIEAAAVSGNDLILLNRGTNDLLKMKREDLSAFLQHQKMPAVSSLPVKLPAYQGHTPGISGACTLSNGDLLFCASIENTKNWYEDGAVLGSYIGIIDPENGCVKSKALIKDKDGAPMKIKLESLDVIDEAKRLLKIAAIADNDDGTTVLLQLEISR